MQVSQLTRFYIAIREDNRITTTHISLYMALFEYWNEKDFSGPVRVSRRMIMEKSKISGIATYHKCIKDLHEFGYIRYLPSKNPVPSSEVRFVDL